MGMKTLNKNLESSLRSIEAEISNLIQKLTETKRQKKKIEKMIALANIGNNTLNKPPKQLAVQKT